nr:reverse transcriptase domain-containing protein [Tanacetum cinerariifolium]
MHPPKKQIEEAVKSRQLSHLIKELKQGNSKGEHSKATKKGETSSKEKSPIIFMVQPWYTRQNVTQNFSTNLEISFLLLESEDGHESPMVIEAEIEGHLIHHMYVDVGVDMAEITKKRPKLDKNEHEILKSF